MTLTVQNERLRSWRGKRIICARCRRKIVGSESAWDGKQRFWCEPCAVRLDRKRR